MWVSTRGGGRRALGVPGPDPLLALPPASRRTDPPSSRPRDPARPRPAPGPGAGSRSRAPGTRWRTSSAPEARGGGGGRALPMYFRAPPPSTLSARPSSDPAPTRRGPQAGRPGGPGRGDGGSGPGDDGRQPDSLFSRPPSPGPPLPSALTAPSSPLSPHTPSRPRRLQPRSDRPLLLRARPRSPQARPAEPPSARGKTGAESPLPAPRREGPKQIYRRVSSNFADSPPRESRLTVRDRRLPRPPTSEDVVTRTPSATAPPR